VYSSRLRSSTAWSAPGGQRGEEGVQPVGEPRGSSERLHVLGWELEDERSGLRPEALDQRRDHRVAGIGRIEEGRVLLAAPGAVPLVEREAGR
jgi:hypothetical protein